LTTLPRLENNDYSKEYALLKEKYAVEESKLIDLYEGHIEKGTLSL